MFAESLYLLECDRSGFKSCFSFVCSKTNLLAECSCWCWHSWIEFQDFFLSILGCSALSEQRASAHRLAPIFLLCFALRYFLCFRLVFLSFIG